MYLSFYGLNEKPFSLTPDTKFLYLGKDCQDALNHLMYGIGEREGFMLLTGEVGTGKTMVLRTLLRSLGQDIRSALVFNPMLEEAELLKSILEDFGIENGHGTKKELIDRLNKFLLAEARQNRRGVLIIDEAQGLSDQVLEQIRLLSNLETEKSKLLHIILAGQVELEQKLESPFLRQLNQRISIRYRLLPLSRIDTEKYIHHRLLVAASNGHITFSAGALNEIFKYSQGIPRLVNLICDRVLLAGYTEQTRHLKKHLVKKAVKGIKNRERVSSPWRNGFRKHFHQASVHVAWIFGLIIVLALFTLTHLGTGSSSSVNVASQALVPSQRLSEDVPQNPVTQNVPVSTRELQDVPGGKVASLDNYGDSGKKEIKETLYAKISPKTRIFFSKGKKKWVEDKGIRGSEVRLEEKQLGDVRSHFHLAVRYQKRREKAKAMEEYKKIIEIDSMNVEAHNNLGVIYKDMGKLDQAVKEFQTVLSMNPRQEKAHNNLGITFYLQGNLEKAIQEFRGVLDINPTNKEAYINLGVVYKRQNRLGKAKRMFENALSIDPHSPEAHYNLGLILEESGDIKEAISHYQRFIDFSGSAYHELTAKVERHLETLSY